MQHLDCRLPWLTAWDLPTWAMVALGVLLAGCQRRAVTPKNGGEEPPAVQPVGGIEPKSTDFEAIGDLDPEVIAAWERAGARFGWEIPVFGDYSSKTPLMTKFVTMRPEKGPALPAFSAGGGRVKSLQSLPAPQAPFALDLKRSPLPAADLKALARFRRLRSLDLINTEIGDETLKELGELRQLQILILAGNRISDAGLKELAGLQDLKMLSLGATDVRGTGLKELAGLRNLETLRLYCPDVDDAACKELAELKQLRVLDLHLSKITDLGLKELSRLKGLELLNVAVTEVTDAGLAEIRKALPNCQVQR